MEPAAPETPPGTPPSGTKSALAFYGVLLALFPPALLAQWGSPVAGLVATQLFAFLVPALVAAAGSNLRIPAYLRLGPPRPALLGLGLLAGAAGYLVAGAVMLLTQRALPASWVEAYDLTRLFEGPPWERAALAGVAALLAPACEEITFRGYLQTTLALRRGPAAAIGLGALLFASLHLDPVRFPALVLLGAVFGWLAWRAGSVWPAVAAHAANNGLAAGLLLAAGPRDPGPPPLAGVVASLGVGAALLALVLLGYRRLAPRPPPAASGAVVLRDPSLPSIRWHPERVPPRLARLAVAGAGVLLLLAAAGLLRGVRR